MKKFLLGLALLLALPMADAQTVLTAPQVLGCTNPAPAVPPAATIWFGSCVTPAFTSTSSTSLVASVSKTAPVWAHTFGGYVNVAPTALVVACPKNATVTGAKCTDSKGVDVSGLVAASAVSAFTLSPAVPTAVSLSWTAPTQNTDGSALTDLASYNVYQGSSVPTLVKVGTSTTMTFTTPSLPPGTYFFAVSAVNTSGTESVLSASISATVAPPAPKTPNAPSDVKSAPSP